ncbi:MAG: hypothetical protein FIA99_10900 [Ruminiclostridium sp.]|nr:hypothetical protein [Ruminiclostridium sp.]
MNQRERFKAIFNFEKVDRVPNTEIGPWVETFEGWKKEGFPSSISCSAPADDRQYSRHSRELCEYFKLDAHIAKVITIRDETVPGPTSEVIEEDSDTKTYKFSNGYVTRNLKSNEGIFHELDWPVKSRRDWEEKIKKFIFPGWHGISPDSPEKLPSEDRDYAVLLDIPGYFWVLRRWMGFEGACTAFYDDPGFVDEAFEFWSEYLLAQCKLVTKYVKPDFAYFAEDMAYKSGSMVSPALLEKYFAPRYKKIADFLNSEGVNIVGVESDGFVDEMIPVLKDAGINLWAPFEIACREGKDDLYTLAEKYPWLRMLGGIDKRILNLGRDAIDEELTKIARVVKRGGFIPHIDHSIPPCPLENYKYYLEQKAKILGGYSI